MLRKYHHSDKRIEFINYFNENKSYIINAEIEGYEQKHSVVLDSIITYKMPFTIYKGEGSKEFTVDMRKEDFNKLTDFTLQILDSTGKAVSKNGLAYRSGGTVTVEMNPDKDSINCTLEIIPAFFQKGLSLNLAVTELTYFPDPQSVSTKISGGAALALYPSSVKYIDLDYSKPEINIPAGAKGYGKLYFKSPSTGATEYETTVRFIF